MNERNDPRVFLASERTLLAWVRTGIAMMGLGFVVAKFGMFLAAAGIATGGSVGHIRSTTIGIGLVLLGGAAVAHAARQHQNLCRNLTPEEIPRDYTFRFAPWFAFTLSAISALLVVHLLLKAAENEAETIVPRAPGTLSDVRPE